MSALAARISFEQPPFGAERRRGARAAGLNYARLLSAGEIAAHERDIAALAERALARNLFYEAPFLIHAAHHLRDAGEPVFLTVWRSAERPRLVGLFPLLAPRPGKPEMFRGWLSHFMTDGAPLIDMACAEQTLHALFDWLGGGDRAAAGVLFPKIDSEGAFATLARAIAAKRGLPVATLGAVERAVLRPREGGALAAPDRKSGKERRRLQRRLEESGALALRAATSRAEARDAFEHFLALEARGWKGRAGTAMMQDDSAAAFARCAIRALAGEGRCRIDLLEFNGATIAATIELLAGDRAYFWKTAFDEAYARFSPGVQMALELTRRHENGDVALVDSCAEPDHPMINGLWPDRMQVVDLFIAAAPDGSAARRALRREAMRRRLRAAAKSVYRAVRRR